VIRQAISCDICGAEKKQTNHWFVVSEQAGELRVSGWNTRNRMRPGSKHLCGQTCLHKLVDEFMARDLATRVQRGVVEESVTSEQIEGTDASLTSDAAYEEVESSARLVPTPMPELEKRIAMRAGTGLVAIPAMPQATAPMMPVASAPEEPQSLRSRTWRAEAWQRERERESRPTAARRRAGS
jgi:hypothetical protein